MLLIDVSFVLHTRTAKNGAYLGIKRLLITDPNVPVSSQNLITEVILFAHFYSSARGSTCFCLLYLQVSP